MTKCLQRIIFGYVVFLVVCFDQKAMAIVTPVTTPWIRVDHALNQMKISPKARFVAYTGDDGLGLSVLNVDTKDIFQVSDQRVGLSFFWSPDGYRLFFRELRRANVPEFTKSALVASVDGAPRVTQSVKTLIPGISSTIKVFDTGLNRTVTLDTIARSTGFLTFDPRDLRFQILSESGIHTKKIYFPSERLAMWQVSSRSETGKWIATQKGILWVTQGGMIMKRLEDDGKELASFDISPDGQWIAWGTEGNKIYLAKSGRRPQFIGHGRDPKWHPTRHMIIFAGARMVGDKAVNFDIKVSDTRGQSKFLTATQFTNERWPQWYRDGEKIIYTVEKTTDLYLMDFKP